MPAQHASCCEFLWALRQAGTLCFWSEVPALQAPPWKELQGQSFFSGFAVGCLRLGRALSSVAKEPFADLVQFPSRCECITGDLGGNSLIVLYLVTLCPDH